MVNNNTNNNVQTSLKIIKPVYNTNHKTGDNNVEIFGMDLHNSVFIVSTLLIVIFVILTLVFPDTAKQSFDASKSWSINNFD
jgi:BCCT family betaine/carnitine transporter